MNGSVSIRELGGGGGGGGGGGVHVGVFLKRLGFLFEEQEET